MHYLVLYQKCNLTCAHTHTYKKKKRKKIKKRANIWCVTDTGVAWEKWAAHSCATRVRFQRSLVDTSRICMHDNVTAVKVGWLFLFLFLFIIIVIIILLSCFEVNYLYRVLIMPGSTKLFTQFFRLGPNLLFWRIKVYKIYLYFSPFYIKYLIF